MKTKTKKRQSEVLLLLTHASEILTGSGIRAKDGRKVREEDLGRIEDAALVFTENDDGSCGRVVWVGETRKIPREFRKIRSDHVLDLERKQGVIPGLIDCHTHLIFAGNRADEFAERCGGATYEEIAARGGGIMSTVRATRDAPISELVRLGAARLEEARLFGIRTIEIKSGYGLSYEAELKQLEAAKKLKKLFPDFTIQTTFLGAHAFPKEMSREKYLNEILNRMLPEVARRKLADACDVFIDQGYYSLAEGERILTRARELGLKIKIHADELYNTESAALAARLGALSADHLLKISDAGIRALAKSETTAVLLPGTAFYLKAAHAPARKLLDAGVRVAVSTDFNPG
ncbi:MAG: imidazolonepropionase, partial [Bdellovibrionota bacterium]